MKKSKSFVWFFYKCYNSNMTNTEIKKVLILRLSALGDTIHTLPAAYAIKKTWPNVQIGWVVEDKAQLFINVLGAVVGERGAHFNARKALFE